ncbi:hypothetical protein Tco_0049340, partial [Tanacetum coccineum]
YDNDDDEYTVIYSKPKAITPDLPIEEPDNSLNPSIFDALNDHSEILSDPNDDGTSSDDDDLRTSNVILREKLLNISRLVTNIQSLKNNPTPDYVFKSPSSFPIPIVDSDSFFEESDTSLSHLDNSLPEFDTFSDHTKETRSGSTMTHANNSLPEYDSFLFEVEPDQGGLTSVVISDNSNDPLLEPPEFESFHFDPSFPRPPPEPPDVENSLIVETNALVINNVDELNEDDDSFTFVIWTFLPFLTNLEVSPLLSSTKNEDTIFDPGISSGWNFHVYPNIHESPIKIFSSIYSLQGRMNSEIESSYV